MRKSFHMALGIVIGVALTISASAAADGLKSLVGKQIDGEFTVTLNGEELAVKAGTIEGTSYLPVRAVSEALNLEVGFNNDTGISLTKKGADKVSTITPRANEVGTLTDKKFEGMSVAEWDGQEYFSLYDFSNLYSKHYKNTNDLPWTISGSDITFYNTDGTQALSTDIYDAKAIIIIQGASYINTKYFPTKFPQ